MDILLPQLQSFFQDNISFARDSDINLIPNPGIIPETVGMPCIGLKDGNVTIHHEMIGGVQERELIAEIYIYDWLERSGKNILGLHEKSRQVSELLRNHCFPGHMASPLPRTEMSVVLLYTKKGLVIRKGLRFQFEKQE